MNKIGYDTLDVSALMHMVNERLPIALDERATARIEESRAFLMKKIGVPGAVHYGINTGFGNMCDRQISPEDLLTLQLNLVRSHAAGAGEQIPDDITRLILLLKIQALSQGFSGVRIELIEQLIWFYNEDVLPIIYEQGSLGASGDLAPLSHMALALIGEGPVRHNGETQAAAEVLDGFGRRPISLEAKEGLALINGTQFCTAYAVWSVYHAQKLYHWANRCLALSCEAFDCDARIFTHLLHQVRGQIGQIKCAESLRSLLIDSGLCTPGTEYVQDPYSFRCAPQVHGASLDTIDHAQLIVEREINSVSDNPVLITEIDDIISGGNFHAQPLALILDFIKIALSELGSISERRGYKLLRGQRALPINLADHPGLESGLMILQYTAASIASQNKQLATPASVDSIVSSAGQEDHVSMGANAATAAARVVDNVYRILAIEWAIGCRAIQYRRIDKSSPEMNRLRTAYEKHHTVETRDHILHTDIVRTVKWMKSSE